MHVHVHEYVHTQSTTPFSTIQDASQAKCVCKRLHTLSCTRPCVTLNALIFASSTHYIGVNYALGSETHCWSCNVQYAVDRTIER